MPLDIKRGFGWVRKTLGLPGSQAPNELDERRIASVLDSAQGGWGHDDTVTAPFRWVSSITNTGTYDLLTGTFQVATDTTPFDLTAQYQLHALSMWLSGDQPRAQDVGLRVSYAALNDFQAVTVATITVPAQQGLFGSVDELSVACGLDCALPLWAPVGARFQLRILTNMTVGALFNVQGIATTMRRGFSGGAPRR